MQSDPAVMRFLGAGAQASRTRTTAESWADMQSALGQWVLRGYGILAIEETATGRIAGRAGVLHPWDWPEPELVWALDRAHWGRGLATEASAAIRDWAFGQFGFPGLASFIHPDNAAAARVAARLGAVREGVIDLSGRPAERWVCYRPGRGPMA
jgi:RimJ/RimL family protein N-acetyltransferase